jgi:hypothetical protein
MREVHVPVRVWRFKPSRAAPNIIANELTILWHDSNHELDKIFKAATYRF